jgi:hypothetical protein
MDNLKILYLIFILSTAIGCTKEEDTDYASIVAGTYTGIVTYGGIGTVSASSILSEGSETEVDLIIIINANTVSLDGIAVSSITNTAFNLSYIDPGGSFTGTVQGDKLEWTLISGLDVAVFSGTR